MDETRYSLQLLAELSGIEARTIRSYIERDLLPGPSGMGPKASYGGEHLDRLKVIGLLRDAHRDLSLDQIRALLVQFPADTIAAIAAGEVPVDSAATPPSPSSSALSYLHSLTPQSGRPSPMRRAPARPAQMAPMAPRTPRAPMPSMPPMPRMAPSSPRSRVSSVSEMAEPSPSSPGSEIDVFEDLDSDPPAPDNRSAGRTPLEELLRALDSTLANENVARSVRHELWHRLPITPDIELAVRGELGTDQLALLQRIGDRLRHLFLKGTRT
ncbi:MAG: MerR family transcriptional regulator [Thermoanaerobaculia bacterium]